MPSIIADKLLICDIRINIDFTPHYNLVALDIDIIFNINWFEVAALTVLCQISDKGSKWMNEKKR